MSNICFKKTIGFLLERHNASIQVTLALRTIEESLTRLLTNASNNTYTLLTRKQLVLTLFCIRSLLINRLNWQ